MRPKEFAGILLGIMCSAVMVQAQGLEQVSSEIDAALKDGLTEQEFNDLLPRATALLNGQIGVTAKVRALNSLYKLGHAFDSQAGQQPENDAVSRFIDAGFESQDLSEDAWQAIADFLRSFSSFQSTPGDRDRLLRGMNQLTKIRAGAKTARLGALALAAKSRAAVWVDRIAGGLEAKDRESILAEIHSAPAEYGPVAIDAKNNYASIVPGNRRELAELYPGRPAPEIQGIDLDGKPMTLSEYRGKVVLLVAWAGWCPDCVKAVPDERAVIESFAAKPFAFVGLNGDESREAGAAAVQKHNVPGRSFWGRWPGTDGKRPLIVDDWNIRSWPSYYVIDAKGVIRFKRCWDTTREELEKGITAAFAAPTHQ